MYAKSGRLIAASAVAIGLLGNSVSAQQSRPFNAGNACGDAQGDIAWRKADGKGKGGIVFEGRLRDFNTTPGSRTSLFVNWKGLKQSKKVATVGNGESAEFSGGAPIDNPKGVLMTVCSDNCKTRWDCGRPG